MTVPHGAPHPCARPGCPALVRGARYCPAHAAASPEAQARRTKRSDPFYHTEAWQKVRAAYLRDHPICEDPLREGCHRLASHVDHRIALSAGGAPYDAANLRALCPGCHARLPGHGWGARKETSR